LLPGLDARLLADSLRQPSTLDNAAKSAKSRYGFLRSGLRFEL